MIYHSEKLFSKEEAYKIRGYVRELKDRVIGTYHEDINQGIHDPKGGHNLADHIPWSLSTEYNWIYNRILDWTKTLDLPKEIVNLGHEIILQKYPVGFEFKPHIDDVLSKDKKTIKRIRHYTILMQLSEESEYKGGGLFIKTDKENKVSKEIGTVSIFSQGIIHWVNPITDGERWSATIFLEKTALEKDLL